jgi:hypothetical protein
LPRNTWETKTRKPAIPKKTLKITKYDPKRGSLGFKAESAADEPKKYRPILNIIRKHPKTMTFQLKLALSPPIKVEPNPQYIIS